ncbi:MAG TPA: D-sedoheptulose 7-phosphate isomerase [Anaerolineales bacterium]|nr:D-sedoheptulose 7-phosphate isomerase [Anaerolineales bacterium]
MSVKQLQDELQIHARLMEQTVEQCAPVIDAIAGSLLDCFRQGNKVLLCGNGGSAADSQHMAAEFVNRFRIDRAALPAIALTVDTSILTAIGNDSSYEFTFSRQVEALGKPGDVLAAISTSGGSPNVLKALEVAHSRGLKTIGFTGEKGRQTMAPKCDLCLVVPSPDTPRVQEVHEFAWHVICGIVERELFPQ